MKSVIGNSDTAFRTDSLFLLLLGAPIFSIYGDKIIERRVIININISVLVIIISWDNLDEVNKEETFSIARGNMKQNIPQKWNRDTYIKL